MPLFLSKLHTKTKIFPEEYVNHMQIKVIKEDKIEPKVLFSKLIICYSIQQLT